MSLRLLRRPASPEPVIKLLGYLLAMIVVSAGIAVVGVQLIGAFVF